MIFFFLAFFSMYAFNNVFIFLALVGDNVIHLLLICVKLVKEFRVFYKLWIQQLKAA